MNLIHTLNERLHLAAPNNKCTLIARIMYCVVPTFVNTNIPHIQAHWVTPML